MSIRQRLGFGVVLITLAVSAAFAQQPGVTAGATVLDPQGGVVGTIRSADSTTAVVWTGTRKVTLGLSSFRLTRKGLTIGMTRDQLENAAAEVQAKGDAEIRDQLTPGAEVRGSDGGVVATVDVLEGDDVTLSIGTMKARLPIASFSGGKDGVRIGMTAAELEAAVQAQVPPKAEADTEAKPGQEQKQE